MRISKLFIAPCAGGSSLTYLGWNKYFPKEIDLHLYDYPGRGRRIGENLLDCIHSVATDFVQYIQQNLGNFKGLYGILGHSMGAIIAYEAYYYLVEKQIRLPTVMIMAACESVHHLSVRNLSSYEPDEIVRYMQSINCLPKNLSKDLFFIGSDIKHDLMMLNHYSCKRLNEKIKTRGIILRGQEDRMSSVDVDKWQDLFENSLTCKDFPGSHFFIKEYEREVTDYICNILS